MGKPTSAHGGEVETACDITNFFAGQVEQAYGQSSLNAPNHLNISLRQPFGVVAAIVPWNFPTMIVSRLRLTVGRPLCADQLRHSGVTKYPLRVAQEMPSS